ncbi:unnamed protein product [Amoebophrya sp. A25]|nr:unnamed protein product [Amoebophrya sp. A25]|eukprot:GSA25T00004296001.1
MASDEGDGVSTDAGPSAETLESAAVWVSDAIAGFLPGEVINFDAVKSGKETELSVGLLRAAEQAGVSNGRSGAAGRKPGAGGGDRSGGGGKKSYVETRTIANATLLRPRNANADTAEATFDDCAGLHHLHDAGILENLRLRYTKDQIYTYTSTVLFAVNPYKDVGQMYYTDAHKKKYRRLPSLHAQPPHPYAIGDLAYRKLVHDRQDQAILISGESGAGKTQTAKIVMGFLVENASGKREQQSETDTLDNMILRSATPILESLGNATTIRNNNSSRFGKFSHLAFNARGDLVGGEIRTYLLESSRVAKFGPGERSYHIFYELLSGAPAALLETLGLERSGGAGKETKQKRYIIAYGSEDDVRKNVPSRGKEEMENFKAFREGLHIMRLNEEGIDAILETIAGLIHLFELEFEDAADGQGVQVAKSTATAHAHQHAARLLGMASEKLCAALCSKAVTIRGSTIRKNRTQQQAKAAQQALTKMLYKRLFDHVVEKINASLMVAGQSRDGGDEGGSGSSRRHIGILDIYGFEQLRTNSFEQLCINLANERLQEFFRERVIVAEQNTYESEGLPKIPIEMTSAEDLLGAIGDTLDLLHDHGCRALKNSSMTNDKQFTSDVIKKSGDYMRQLKRGGRAKGKPGAGGNHELDAALAFVVTHYAGEVSYSTDGWLDKNNSVLSEECETLIAESQHSVIAKLTGEGDGDQTSVAAKYQVDLDALLDTLAGCNLHYIRTFKPNLSQAPGKWEGGALLDQMLQSGSVDLVKIMHEGYPHRCDYTALYRRFEPSLPAELQQLENPLIFIVALMASLEIPKTEYAIGSSRLFLKSGCLALVDELTDNGGGIPDNILQNLRRLVRAKKVRRCFHTVTLCLFLPKFLKEVRIAKHVRGLKIAARNYVRIHRWCEHVRKRLRDLRIESCIRKMQQAWRCARGFVRLLTQARRRIACRRNVDIAFRLYPTLCRFLRRWVTRERERVRRRLELWAGVCNYVRLSRFLSRAVRDRRAKRRREQRKLVDGNMAFFHAIVLLRRRMLSGCVAPGGRSKVFTVREFGLLQKRATIQKGEDSHASRMSVLQKLRRRLRTKKLLSLFFRHALLSTVFRRFVEHRRTSKKSWPAIFRGVARATGKFKRALLRARARKVEQLEKRMRTHKLIMHMCRFALLVKPARKYIRRLRGRMRAKRNSTALGATPNGRISAADESGAIATGDGVLITQERWEMIQEMEKRFKVIEQHYLTENRRSVQRDSRSTPPRDSRDSLPPGELLSFSFVSSVTPGDAPTAEQSPSESWPGQTLEEMGVHLRDRQGVVTTHRGSYTARREEEEDDDHANNPEEANGAAFADAPPTKDRSSTTFESSAPSGGIISKKHPIGCLSTTGTTFDLHPQFLEGAPIAGSEVDINMAPKRHTFAMGEEGCLTASKESTRDGSDGASSACNTSKETASSSGVTSGGGSKSSVLGDATAPFSESRNSGVAGESLTSSRTLLGGTPVKRLSDHQKDTTGGVKPAAAAGAAAVKSSLEQDKLFDTKFDVAAMKRMKKKNNFRRASLAGSSVAGLNTDTSADLSAGGRPMVPPLALHKFIPPDRRMISDVDRASPTSQVSSNFTSISQRTPYYAESARGPPRDACMPLGFSACSPTEHHLGAPQSARGTRSDPYHGYRYHYDHPSGPMGYPHPGYHPHQAGPLHPGYHHPAHGYHPSAPSSGYHHPVPGSGYPQPPPGTFPRDGCDNNEEHSMSTAAGGSSSSRGSSSSGSAVRARSSLPAQRSAGAGSFAYPPMGGAFSGHYMPHPGVAEEFPPFAAAYPPGATPMYNGCVPQHPDAVVPPPGHRGYYYPPHHPGSHVVAGYPVVPDPHDPHAYLGGPVVGAVGVAPGHEADHQSKQERGSLNPRASPERKTSSGGLLSGGLLSKLSGRNSTESKSSPRESPARGGLFSRLFGGGGKKK